MKTLRWVLFIAYCGFIVWYTIISRNPGEPKANLRLFWSYREMITGDPNWKKDVFQNLQNIAFFIPFGVLLPVKKWKAVLITAIIFSAAIEIVQYFGGYGLADLKLVLTTVRSAFIKAEGITDGENATALDYGDVLLRDGKISKSKYDALQAYARNLIEEHEGRR